MALLDGPTGVPEPGGVQIKGEPLDWIGGQPPQGHLAGRPPSPSTPARQWSRDHFDDEEAEIPHSLLSLAGERLGTDLASTAVETSLARWRYSWVTQSRTRSPASSPRLARRSCSAGTPSGSRRSRGPRSPASPPRTASSAGMPDPGWNSVLLANLAATLFMVGIIWFVQIVHYPLFSRVGGAGFAAYSEAHSRLTGLVVGPPMLVEAATTVALVIRSSTRRSRLAAPASGSSCSAVSGSPPPCCRRRATGELGLGFDTASHRFLVAPTGCAPAAGAPAASSCSGWRRKRRVERGPWGARS